MGVRGRSGEKKVAEIRRSKIRTASKQFTRAKALKLIASTHNVEILSEYTFINTEGQEKKLEEHQNKHVRAALEKKLDKMIQQVQEQQVA